VHVLEHEHERPVAAQRGEQLAERPGQRVGRRVAAEAERGADRRGCRLTLLGRLEQRVKRLPVLRLQHDLAQRPVRDAVPVRRAVPDEHACTRAHAAGELAHQARLADPRLAEQQHQLAAPGPQPPDDVLKSLQLGVASHPRGRLLRRAHRRPDGRVERQAAGPRAAGQPRRRREHLAGGQHGGIPDQRGPGRHADAHLQREVHRARELTEPPLECRGRAHRSGGLVLVRARRAEHGEHALGHRRDDRIAVTAGDRLHLVGADAEHVVAHLEVDRPGGPQLDRDADHGPPCGRRRVLRRDLRTPGPPRRERLGPAPAGHQRADELAAERLPQRMLDDEGGELVEHALGVPEGQVGVDARGQAGGPLLLQPGDLRRRIGLVAHAVQRRSAPQRQRRTQQLRRDGRLAAGERGLAGRGEATEAVGVDDVARGQAQRVTAGVADDRVRAERPAQPRHDELQRVVGMGRELLAPQRVDGAVDRDRRPAADEQEPEQPQRLAARPHGPAVRAQRLDGPEDAELHGCFVGVSEIRAAIVSLRDRRRQ
jgi:hypothetical protein